MEPSNSIYNELCDIEWDTPIGDTKSCGGDVLITVRAFLQAGGFRADIIAGEEPELCLRLRKMGWKIRRLDAEMTLHDANIKNFSQWWKRAQRAGYAYTNGAWLHRGSGERYNVRPLLRILFWALILPFSALVGLLVTKFSVLLLALYILQYVRLLDKGPRTPRVNRYWAKYIIIGKFAEFTGMLRCMVDIVLTKKSSIIEYK